MIAIMNILATAGSNAGDGSTFSPLGILLIIGVIVLAIRDGLNGQGGGGVNHNNRQANNQQARNYNGQANKPASNPGRDNIPRPQTW